MSYVGESVFLKRAMDILAAGLALLLLSPFLALIALAVRLTSPGPALYVDERAGRGGRAFRAYKVRTMVQNARQQGLGLEVAHERCPYHPGGTLPAHLEPGRAAQLLNVLLGDMSLVGPRPTVPSQVARYSAQQRRRLAVRPGITGLAQVNGRNGIPWSRRIELDLYYVDHWSLWLDLRILLRTLAVVLGRDGLYGVDGIARDLDG